VVRRGSGEAIFTWRSLDHVSPDECYVPPSTTNASQFEPWDYFHINSAEKDSKGNFLISARHCHAVYYISGSSGDVLWRLNGKNSTFAMGNNTAFWFQHDARWQAENDSLISYGDPVLHAWTSSLNLRFAMAPVFLTMQQPPGKAMLPLQGESSSLSITTQ
jgi:hypothetical protein